jgi:NAD(P)-dependent dehydrogenase (short-subunit alcohol dehydrogenase family)
MIQERRLDGSVAIVTGAGGGIGRATSFSLAALGCRLVVVDRETRRAGTVLKDIEKAGGEGIAIALDVRMDGDMKEMAQRTLDRYSRIDILVASAGVLRGGPPRVVAEMPVPEWDVVVDTNLKGVFLSNRAVLPAMLKQGSGAIINLSSTSGRKGLAYDSAYCASKFGVIGFSEALAEEVRVHGIKVQVILPGPVDTPMWEQNSGVFRPLDILPPERVADFISYLVTLPEDTVLLSPSIVPTRKPRRSRGATS